MSKINLILLAPSDKYKSGIASYTDNLEQILSKYLSKEVKVIRVTSKSYLTTIVNTKGNFVVLAQMGSNDGEIFQVLLRQTEQHIYRIIELHDPEYFVLSYSKHLQTFSKWFLGRVYRRVIHKIASNYYIKKLIRQHDILVCKTAIGSINLGARMANLGIKIPICYIDLPNYLDPPIKPRISKQNTSCLGFFGYIHPNKGIHILIESAIALAKCKGIESVPSISIRGAVSTENHKKYLQNLKHKIYMAGLQDKVTFGDFISPEELPEFVSHLTAMVLPYTDKNRISASGPLIWARTCGIPVIAHRTAAFESTIQHNIDGLLIPMNDINAWASVMEEIATQPNWGRKLYEGLICRQQATSWKATADKYSSLIMGER